MDAGRDGEVTLKGSVPGGSALVGQGQSLCARQVQAFAGLCRPFFFFLARLLWTLPGNRQWQITMDRNGLTGD